MDRRQLVLLGTILVVLLVVGSLGFHFLEGWSLFDSAYATIITLTSIGYGDFAPKTPGGRVFALGLISIGFGAAAYTFTNLYGLILSGSARRAFKQRKLQRMITSIRDHVIVCGYGQMGQEAAANLRRLDVPIVIVEIDADRARQAEDDGRLVINGDASEEEVLLQAGVERARTLIATANSDAQNVFIALTARQLDQDLLIVARADRESSRPKLEKAGANRIILPYSLGAERMANLVKRPNVADFIDEVLGHDEFGLALEEIDVPENSPMIGKTLFECRARQDHGVTILAIVDPRRGTSAAPDGEVKIDAHSILVCFGPRAGLESFCATLGVAH
jgi:voltage-gated potassium channel